jgi:hypothetical protein
MDINEIRKSSKPKPLQDETEQVLGREPLKPTPLIPADQEKKNTHD